MSRSEYFIGTWKLEVWKATLPDGTVIYPLGKKAIGYLMYNSDGFMAVSMMAGNGDAPEIGPTHFSYFGTYQVLSEDVVLHFIKICSYPDFVDTCQERHVKREDFETMILTSPPSKETGQVNCLIWKRIPHGK